MAAIGRILTFATATLLAGLTVAIAAENRPAVIELFTSQGCSSCPPADAFLAELARRPDVIALGYHIDYWDGLGWKDPLSSREATARQRTYAQQFGRRQVYTPQIVVDGIEEAVGSDRREVAALLSRAAPHADAPVAFAADGRRIAIGAGEGNGKILLLRLARERTTRIDAGENARRTLTDVNGVKTLATLGEWHGGAVEFPIDPPAAGEGVAVIVQDNNGRILGAASLFAPG